MKHSLREALTRQTGPAAEVVWRATSRPQPASSTTERCRRARIVHVCPVLPLCHRRPQICRRPKLPSCPSARRLPVCPSASEPPTRPTQVQQRRAVCAPVSQRVHLRVHLRVPSPTRDPRAARVCLVIASGPVKLPHIANFSGRRALCPRAPNAGACCCCRCRCRRHRRRRCRIRACIVADAMLAGASTP